MSIDIKKFSHFCAPDDGTNDQRSISMFANPLSAIRIVASLAFWIVLTGGPTSAAESLDGYWQDSDGEVILEIKACGAARCGRVAWLKQPFGPDGKLLLDYRNPDPALRARPVCGLQVLTGFKKQPDGTWGDGTVYVSDEGMSFSGYAEVLSSTRVKVTGYIGLAIFGASEVWTKVAKPSVSCTDDRSKS